MSKPRKIHERTVDEMAVALCGLRSLDNEAACIVALMDQGFRAAVIMKFLDEALELARMARADGWQEPAQVSPDA